MLKNIKLFLMSKDEVEKAEARANFLLDQFIEAYLELHQTIHHRDKTEVKKLKKEFGDIYKADEIAEKNLYKFVMHVNKINKKDQK